jgi:FkbM family methyltransferase
MAFFVSYAQNFEDVMLWRALKHLENGFYIDVGAAHPEEWSITKAFYDRGWHGVSIEPEPDYAELLRQTRTREVVVEAALGTAPGRMTVNRFAGTGLTTFDNDIAARHAEAGFTLLPLEVEVTTLAAICRKHAPGEIHFLKIDVEGAERAVLEGADFANYRPWIVLVEATEPMSMTPNHANWEPILLTAGYSFAWFDGLNRFYLAEERQAELRPFFQSPPNVFDEFVRAKEVVLETAATQAAARASAAESLAAEAARRTAAAEARTAEAVVKATAAEVRRDQAEMQALAANARASDAETRKAAAEARAAQAAANASEAENLRAEAEARAAQANARTAEAERRRASAEAIREGLQAALAAVHSSTSWRITAPVRTVRFLLRGRVGSALIEAGVPRARIERLHHVAATDAGRSKQVARISFYALARMAARLPGSARLGSGLEWLAPALWKWLQRRDAAYLASALAAPREPSGASMYESLIPPHAIDDRRPIPTKAPTTGNRIYKVHQFHSGSATGDAITNAMFLMQTELRALGYDSDIFVEHRAPDLADRLFEIDDLPRHPDYVLIVHHSMGYDACERIAALPARKILMYHNITPPEFLTDSPFMKSYAELGRRQLELLRPQMIAALADSEFNALELRTLGYDAPVACPFLFDVTALVAQAGQRGNRPDDAPFTILFVGRVVASKGQAELVDAFAEFRRGWGRPCRLVLIGRVAAPDAPYPAEISRRIALHGLQDEVLLTGLVSDEELHAWYGTADAYVSLSQHEGFGVPLVEAMAHDLPVIAWPSGAVPYTLGGAGVLLPDRSPETVAATILDLAHAPERRAEIVARQHAVLDGFRLERQIPRLVRALLAAGAATPPRDAPRRSMADNMRVTVTGHINGTYSLATINRMMALTLEAHLPGTVRVVPWENGPTGDLSGVPAEHARQIAALTSRPLPPTGPQIVISQHYPLLVPEPRGDAAFALFAWEESLVPQATIEAVEAGFTGVFVPTEFVAKALIDSGLSIAVRTTGQPPDLDAFYRLGQERRAAAPSGADVFTFLHVSSCFPRKGVDVLLAAYARAFRKADRVRLVIKGFPNPHNDVPEQIEKLRQRDPDIADIIMINEDRDADAMLDLYRGADAMVLPTRGEGFNLPAAEAMAAGIPLIVTGYGGHVDFCTPAEARYIDFGFAASRSHLAVPGSVWVEPDQADLAVALRELFDDRAGGGGTSAVRARRAETAVRHRLAPRDWVDRFRRAALDTLTAPTLPAMRIAWVSTWDVKCGIAEYSRFLLDPFARPESGRIESVLVLCDRRTPPSNHDAFRVQPAWETLNTNSMDDVARATAVADCDAVVIQHQPGLIAWSDLARLLSDRRVRCKITIVTLHAAMRLLDCAADEREAVVAALGSVSRILVHRVMDLDLLKSLGLTRNVTLFPQGAPARAAAALPRALSPSDAPVICCYGFFLPAKGIPRLIEAVAQLRRAWPNLRLRLVNSEYPSPVSVEEIALCRRLAASLDLDDAIEWDTAFHPHDESIRRLSGCDLLVLPYDESKESSSAALRSALSSGVPVAVTPIAIFEEAGAAVHRFPNLDVASMAADIDALLSDHMARARYQESAATWLAERAWDVLARRMSGMLRGLHASRFAEEPSSLERMAAEPNS